MLLLSTAPVWMQTSSRQPHGFLHKYFNFSKEDLAAIEIGKIVAKLPKTIDKREVAALGVVRMSVSKELFLERFMDIESFKKSEIVGQVRKFSSPPRSEDLRELDLDQSPYLFETAPDLLKYLADFPQAQLPGAENFIYWSKEKQRGFKTVLGLTHVTVYRQKEERGADHNCFEAALR